LRKLLGEEKGFALVATILILLIVSILGIAIVSTATSNLRLTRMDSRSQSAYYIAEAGLNEIVDRINTKIHDKNNNYKTGDDLFRDIESLFLKDFTLDDFDLNRGEQPKSLVTVTCAATDRDMRRYKIKSIGTIGSSTRTVSTMIDISWESQQEIGDMEDVFIYSPQTYFTGETINGKGGTIISNGLTDKNFHGGTKLNVTNIYFADSVVLTGGLPILGSDSNDGRIYIDGDFKLGTWGHVYGDVYVNGDLRPGGITFHGNVYVNGDVEFGENVGPIKRIEYTGKITAPSHLTLPKNLVKVSSVPSFEIPLLDIRLRDDLWYKNQGYDIVGTVTVDQAPKNAKVYANNYTIKNNINSLDDNKIIISKGDISINGGWNKFTGALIAPNGEVSLGQGEFNGIIISKNGLRVVGGGGVINMRTLSDFFTEDTMPIGVYKGGQGDNGGSSYGQGKMEITSPTREE
jgi:type II secretory pathway pseudopilin PulG